MEGEEASWVCTGVTDSSFTWTGFSPTFIISCGMEVMLVGVTKAGEVGVAVGVVLSVGDSREVVAVTAVGSVAKDTECREGR